MDETGQDTLNSLANIGLKLLAWLAVLVIGWIIAELVGRVVERLLDRSGLNGVAERTGLHRWTGRYTAAGLLGRLVYYALLLVTLQLAFAVLGPNPVGDLLADVIAWLPRLIVAVAVLVAAILLAGAVFEIVQNALGSLPYGRLVGRAAQGTIIALGLIAALDQVEVARSVTIPLLIAALATVTGILVVGVGGGLIQPMRHRWERILDRAEQEGARIAEARRTAASVAAPQPGGGTPPPPAPPPAPPGTDG